MSLALEMFAVAPAQGPANLTEAQRALLMGKARWVRAAFEAGLDTIPTIALTGAFGARMAAHCDCVLTLPSNDTARIQEAHILVGHMLCDWIEQALMTDSSARTPVSTAA